MYLFCVFSQTGFILNYLYFIFMMKLFPEVGQLDLLGRRSFTGHFPGDKPCSSLSAVTKVLKRKADKRDDWR